MSYHKSTIDQHASALARKSYSAKELCHYTTERLTLDENINAVVEVMHDLANAQAQKADEMLASGSPCSALCGVPIGIKSNIAVKGYTNSCSSKMLAEYISPYHATVVNRLLDVGAVPVFQTNMDEFAMGSNNETSYFGPCKNPWNLDRVPGGSSGGSAAAVAARFAPAALGSDTGGSIRQPAAFCGLTGLKPTYGTVSRFGVVAFASSLDQIGPIATTAKDVAHVLNVIAGHDANDMTSLSHICDYTKDLDKPIKGMRIGVPRQFFTEDLSSEIGDRVYSVIDQLTAMGAKPVQIDLQNTKHAVPVYYIIAPSEASSNLARFDGSRYGYHCQDPASLEDLYKRTRSEGFGHEVKRRIILGTFALSSGYYDAYYQKARSVGELIKQEFTDAFDHVDAIIAPTTPTPAYPFNHSSNPVDVYLSDIYTIPANLAGLPAISASCGFSNGLPIGFQLIGPRLADHRLLNIVHQYQQVTDWHNQIPQDFI